MTGDRRLTRRTTLKLGGAVVSTTVLAGCSGGDNGDTDASDEDEDVDEEEWQDVHEIYLEGVSDNWIGVEPPAIDSVPNPTLALVEGREYELTIENGDDFPHNIAIQDIEGNGILGTEFVDDEGDTLTVTFEASADMYEYLCGSHQNTMIGRIEIISA